MNTEQEEPTTPEPSPDVPAEPKKNRTWLFVIIGVIIIGAVVAGAIVANSSSDDSSDVDWTTDDFFVDLITIESSCYDSAGGLITVEPDLSVVNVEDWDEDATIVYEIRGGEHTETFSIDIQSDGQYSVDHEIISTADCDDTLSTEVTELLIR